MLSAPLACLETSCISFSFLFRVKMPRLVLSLPQRPFCAVGKLGRRKCGRGGRKVREGGGGWWGAHEDSAVATPPLVSLWNDVVISRGSCCRLVSQATESSDSQKSVVFTGYMPLRRIEPTFEFARKKRSFCQFLQSKTIKIEPVI